MTHQHSLHSGRSGRVTTTAANHDDTGAVCERGTAEPGEQRKQRVGQR